MNINFNSSFAAAGANSWFAGDHCPHVVLLLLMSGLGTMRGFIPANTSRCRDAATVVHLQTPSPAVHRCLADIKAMFDNTNTRRKRLLNCYTTLTLRPNFNIDVETQKTLFLKILYNIKYRLTALTCLVPGSALAPGQLWLLVTWHQNKSMNEFNKGRKRAIKLHGCGGAGLFQLLHLYYPILCRYVTCPASICMLLVLLCTARQPLCWLCQSAISGAAPAILHSLLQSQGRQVIDVIGGHFLYAFWGV